MLHRKDQASASRRFRRQEGMADMANASEEKRSARRGKTFHNKVADRRDFQHRQFMPKLKEDLPPFFYKANMGGPAGRNFLPDLKKRHMKKPLDLKTASQVQQNKDAKAVAPALKMLSGPN